MVLVVFDVGEKQERRELSKMKTRGVAGATAAKPSAAIAYELRVPPAVFLLIGLLLAAEYQCADREALSRPDKL